MKCLFCSKKVEDYEVYSVYSPYLDVEYVACPECFNKRKGTFIVSCASCSSSVFNPNLDRKNPLSPEDILCGNCNYYLYRGHWYSHFAADEDIE